MRTRKTKLALAAAVVLVLGAASGVALAGMRLRTLGAGGTQTYAYVVREDFASTTTSTSFATFASAPVSVTDGSDLILARFSAESACYSPNSVANNYCSVRLVLVNRTTGALIAEMYPQAGLNYAFDSTNNGRDGASSWEGHSLDRSIRVGNGSYLVVAQRAVTSGLTTFWLDDWSLTVEKST